MKIKKPTLIILLLCTSFVLSDSRIFDYVISRYNLEKFYHVFPIMFSAYFVTFSIMFTDDMGHFDRIWKKYPYIKLTRDFILRSCAVVLAIFNAIPIVVNNLLDRDDRADVSNFVANKVRELDSYSIEARSILPSGVAFIIIAPLYQCGIISEEGLTIVSDIFDYAISLVGLWLVIVNVKAKYGVNQENNKQ